MQQELSKKFIIIGLSLSGFFWANITKAVCPACVVVVGAGLGFSRWLGVDDVISSLWIGAILSALSLWTIDWIEKKNRKFKYYKSSVWLVYYLLTLVPLYFYDVIGHPLNKIFGIDKIIFGTILGTLIFLGSTWLSIYLKKKNGGKVYFPYQKVVIPFLILFIISLILWKTI